MLLLWCNQYLDRVYFFQEILLHRTNGGITRIKIYVICIINSIGHRPTTLTTSITKKQVTFAGSMVGTKMVALSFSSSLGENTGGASCAISICFSTSSMTLSDTGLSTFGGARSAMLSC